MNLNPNHIVTQQMDGNWHKIVAILLMKMGETDVTITEADVLSMQPGFCIGVQELTDGLHIRLLSSEEGQELARKEGGLPT